MELTTKGRYAVTALADLARHTGAEGEDANALPLSAIAERQKISLPYLEQLFVPLRRAGLVTSARGRSGGYRLARAAGEISVGDVMAAVDETTRFERCAHEGPACPTGTPCITHHLWSGLGEVTSQYFDSLTLADVIAMSASAPKPAPKLKAAADVLPARTYLDFNATAPLRAEARAAMISAMEATGNPSSVHAEGRAARAIIEDAREHVASLVNARPQDVIFNSGGSEGVNAVIGSGFDVVIYADIEHDCVRAAAEASRARRHKLSVGRDGRIDLADVEAALQSYDPCHSTILIVVQLANNETGVIQPVAKIAELARQYGAILMCDAVQAAGKIPLDASALGAHALIVSAHKFGGPKGVGAIVTQHDWRVAPIIRGGGQERRHRAGTENITGIAGFGAAAKIARETLSENDRVRALRDQLEADIVLVSPSAVIAGQSADRLPNTTCVAMPGIAAQTQVIRFDLAGLAVSSGAACSSGKVAASHVLSAMGLDEIAGNAIRISLGWTTTNADIARLTAAWRAIHGGNQTRSVA